LISSIELELLIMKPGTEAPIVIESKVTKIPVKVTMFTFYLLNQFKANLLGVFKMKIFPIATKKEPKRQNFESPTFKSNLIQIPVVTKAAPTANEIFMPYLFRSQLQGTEKRG